MTPIHATDTVTLKRQPAQEYGSCRHKSTSQCSLNYDIPRERSTSTNIIRMPTTRFLSLSLRPSFSSYNSFFYVFLFFLQGFKFFLKS